MIIKDNFSEILLIAEQPVIFYLEHPKLLHNVDVKMNILPIKNTLLDPHTKAGLSLIQQTKAEMQKMINNTEIQSLWELINLFLQQEQVNIITREMFYLYDQLFGDDFSIKDKEIYIGPIKLEEQLFKRINEITLISAGLLDFSKQAKFDEGKPQWLIDKEAEIARIKNQKKDKQSDSKTCEGLMKVLVPLNYELGYTMEELFNMNYFHVTYLSKYIPKMIGYDIQKRQIMSKKKIKYITEK